MNTLEYVEIARDASHITCTKVYCYNSILLVIFSFNFFIFIYLLCACGCGCYEHTIAMHMETREQHLGAGSPLPNMTQGWNTHRQARHQAPYHTHILPDPIFNLALCLTYKLNFMMDSYVYEKKT